MCVSVEELIVQIWQGGGRKKLRDENTDEYVDIHAVWQIELQRVSETK